MYEENTNTMAIPIYRVLPYPVITSSCKALHVIVGWFQNIIKQCAINLLLHHFRTYPFSFYLSIALMEEF